MNADVAFNLWLAAVGLYLYWYSQGGTFRWGGKR